MHGISRVPYTARTAAVFTEILKISRSCPKVAMTWDELYAQADALERSLKILIHEAKMLDYENHALRERLEKEGTSINFTWPAQATEDDLVSRSIAYLARTR